MHALLNGSSYVFPTVFPAVLLAMGGLLRACAARHRLIVEEQVKIRLMTEAEARREIRIVRWTAPTLIVAGLVYTALLRLDLFH